MHNRAPNRLVDTFPPDSAVYATCNQNMRVLGAGKAERGTGDDGEVRDWIGVPLRVVDNTDDLSC